MRPLSQGLLWVGVAIAWGCVGPGTGDRNGEGSGTSGGGHTGSVDELRSLIQAGAIAPVVADVREVEEGAPTLDAREPIDPALLAGSTLPSLGIPTGSSAKGSEASAPSGGLIDPDPAEMAAYEFEGGLDAEQLDAEIEALAAAIESDLATEDEYEAVRPGAALSDTLPQPGLAARRGESPTANVVPNPYLEFGERIYVHDDGRITKPFQVAPGKGRALMQMMGLAQAFAFEWTILDSAKSDVPPAREQVLPPEVADVVLLEKWDFELYQNFATDIQQSPQQPSRIDLADWVVVTAGRDVLLQVQEFVELFAASVPQVEITASIVEFTYFDELDYGVNGPDGSVVFDFPDGTFVDSFSYSVPNTVDGVEAVLSIGAIQDGVAINALLEAIQEWENVDIRTNPRIAVREGGVAEILNTRQIPTFLFGNISSTSQNFTAQVKFEEVGVKLYVAPRVMGSKTLALNLFVEASAQIGTSVSLTDSQGNEFRSPLIAQRQARTVVYLQPGQAIAIGGLISEREQESESKVPILGDIPLIGWLFKSTRIRKERTEVLFLIQPRILEGADFNQPVWDGSRTVPLRG
ncbi:type II secretion system protein GspD [Engelhardtia mirabilis]|uniref:type II secretion system protein GspD n=1 Tax=Engelhardtia mirabilis TaxID=2528011 RepID=UPI001189A9C4|nr:Type II secretion system protein D precursor [Planctomycetes bacterium Pla86]